MKQNQNLLCNSKQSKIVNQVKLFKNSNLFNHEILYPWRVMMPKMFIIVFLAYLFIQPSKYLIKTAVAATEIPFIKDKITSFVIQELHKTENKALTEDKFENKIVKQCEEWQNESPTYNDQLACVTLGKQALKEQFAKILNSMKVDIESSIKANINIEDNSDLSFDDFLKMNDDFCKKLSYLKLLVDKECRPHGKKFLESIINIKVSTGAIENNVNKIVEKYSPSDEETTAKYIADSCTSATNSIKSGRRLAYRKACISEVKLKLGVKQSPPSVSTANSATSAGTSTGSMVAATAGVVATSATAAGAAVTPATKRAAAVEATATATATTTTATTVATTTTAGIETAETPESAERKKIIACIKNNKKTENENEDTHSRKLKKCFISDAKITFESVKNFFDINKTRCKEKNDTDCSLLIDAYKETCRSGEACKMNNESLKMFYNNRMNINFFKIGDGIIECKKLRTQNERDTCFKKLNEKVFNTIIPNSCDDAQCLASAAVDISKLTTNLCDNIKDVKQLNDCHSQRSDFGNFTIGIGSFEGCLDSNLKKLYTSVKSGQRSEKLSPLPSSILPSSILPNKDTALSNIETNKKQKDDPLESEAIEYCTKLSECSDFYSKYKESERYKNFMGSSFENTIKENHNKCITSAKETITNMAKLKLIIKNEFKSKILEKIDTNARAGIKPTPEKLCQEVVSTLGTTNLEITNIDLGIVNIEKKFLELECIELRQNILNDISRFKSTRDVANLFNDQLKLVDEKECVTVEDTCGKITTIADQLEKILERSENDIVKTGTRGKYIYSQKAENYSKDKNRFIDLVKDELYAQCSERITSQNCRKKSELYKKYDDKVIVHLNVGSELSDAVPTMYFNVKKMEDCFEKKPPTATKLCYSKFDSEALKYNKQVECYKKELNKESRKVCLDKVRKNYDYVLDVEAFFHNIQRCKYSSEYLLSGIQTTCKKSSDDLLTKCKEFRKFDFPGFHEGIFYFEDKKEYNRALKRGEKGNLLSAKASYRCKEADNCFDVLEGTPLWDECSSQPTEVLEQTHVQDGERGNPAGNAK